MDYWGARRRFLALAGGLLAAGCQGFPEETATPTFGYGGAPTATSTEPAPSSGGDGERDGGGDGGGGNEARSTAGWYGVQEYGQFGYGGVPGRR